MVSGQSANLKEFTATRTATIQRNVAKIKEIEIGDEQNDIFSNCRVTWKNMVRKFNAQADVLTKGTLDPEYLQSHEWIHGPKYISEEVGAWPTTEIR